MNCQFRTIRAGSAALGLSVVVASVTWQNVLLLFMATGVGFSLWTWLKDRRGLKANDVKVNVIGKGWSSNNNVRDKVDAKVYQFRYPMVQASSQRQ